MKGNTKLKSQKPSRTDWGKYSASKQRILAPQTTSNRTKVRKYVISSIIKLFVLVLMVFIVYQVFVAAKGLGQKLNPLAKIKEISTTLAPSPSLFEPYLHSTLIEPRTYTAINALGVPESATIKLPARPNDTLESLAIRAGFSGQDALAIEQSYSAFKEKSSIPISLKTTGAVEFQMTSDGVPTKVKMLLDEQTNLSLNRMSSGLYQASLADVEKKTGERVLYGSIEKSFGAAAVKSGLSYGLVDDLVDIFSDRVSFHKDFRRGDRFTVIYKEHEVIDGNKPASGTILAAALQINGKQLVAIRFVGSDGKVRYFNEKGQVLGESFLRFPVKFSKISSYFTTARFHPVLKIKRPHNGVDFAAPTGTPVRTVGDGVVQFAGRKGGHGNIVEIRHSDRFVTGYSHLSTISSGLKRGARVARGDVIGAVGMTGLATGPHLHFSLYDNGKYVDPLKSDLPRLEENAKAREMSESYFKRVMFTLDHYQSVASSSLETGF